MIFVRSAARYPTPWHWRFALFPTMVASTTGPDGRNYDTYVWLRLYQIRWTGRSTYEHRVSGHSPAGFSELPEY